MTGEVAGYGWGSDFANFSSTEPIVIRTSLQTFIKDAGEPQIKAWRDSIPVLQRETGEMMACDSSAGTYEAILEYELPMESRRTDAIFLVPGAVVVLELKGKERPSQADLDQVAAYARDLRCYHRECHATLVVPVLVPMRSRGYQGEVDGVHIAGPDVIDRMVQERRLLDIPPIPSGRFLSSLAYQPLPTIVEAARELMRSGKIRAIHRAGAATEPALEAIAAIIHEAARTGTRRLVLLTGVPGAGKTLVGLQTVHAHFLDDLAVDRGSGKPTAPAVFLSGNGPLVQVLQYELTREGANGKTFVRGVMDYVKAYSRRPDRVPPEHVLVFDEAQRAFDAEQVQEKHSKEPGCVGGKSEPEHFIDFAERIPGWCVVIGLIGSGQEIHIGEEGGTVQWRRALEKAHDPSAWKVHLPPGLESDYQGSAISREVVSALNLTTELRYQGAQDLHLFVDGLLNGAPVDNLRSLAASLQRQTYHLRISRELGAAKNYLSDRYGEDPDARFGLLASSKDKDLVRFGVLNDFQSTKIIRFGPWYADPEDGPDGRSCRLLRDCITEFGAQGLELDAVLLAWGTDFLRDGDRWSNDLARGYLHKSRVKDPFQLRLNAYRVLLTRGRDATVVFVPPIPRLDETFEYLVAAGFKPI